LVAIYPNIPTRIQHAPLISSISEMFPSSFEKKKMVTGFLSSNSKFSVRGYLLAPAITYPRDRGFRADDNNPVAIFSLPDTWRKPAIWRAQVTWESFKTWPSVCNFQMYEF
jgi:hypothetical protein